MAIEDFEKLSRRLKQESAQALSKAIYDVTFAWMESTPERREMAFKSLSWIDGCLLRIMADDVEELQVEKKRAAEA